MKILYFTDSHLRTTVPKWRVDNFYETQFKKMHELVDIAKIRKCDVIVSGGDFFDEFAVGEKLINDVLNWRKSFNIPLLTVLGGHDIEARNLHLLSNTSIGVLFNTNVFADWKSYPQFTSINFTDELPKNLIADSSEKYKIIVIHNMIVPSNQKYPFEYLSPEQVQTNADLVLCGHWHSPFLERVNKTTFINPGSLLRLTSAKGDMNRDVQVLFIDTEKRELEFIKLKSGKPYQEVFNIGGIEKEHELSEKSEKFKQFFSQLKTFNVDYLNDFSLLLTSYGKQIGVESVILEESIKRIEEIKRRGL